MDNLNDEKPIVQHAKPTVTQQAHMDRIPFPTITLRTLKTAQRAQKHRHKPFPYWNDHFATKQNRDYSQSQSLVETMTKPKLLIEQKEEKRKERKERSVGVKWY